MCLSQIKRGECVRVLRIDSDVIRAQLIRLGICEGSCLTCQERIPFGPFMVRHNRQEIAIGREIANCISVAREVAA